MQTGIIKKVKTIGIRPVLVHDLVFIERCTVKISVDCLAIDEEGNGGFLASATFIFLKDSKGLVYEGDQRGNNQVAIEYMGNGITLASFRFSVINDRIFIHAVGEPEKKIIYKFNIYPQYLQL